MDQRQPDPDDNAVSHPAVHGARQSKAHAEGHGAHRDMVADFRKRFWVCLVLTVPVVLLSPMIQRRLGLGRLAFTGQELVQFLFASAIFFYGGWPF